MVSGEVDYSHVDMHLWNLKKVDMVSPRFVCMYCFLCLSSCGKNSLGHKSHCGVLYTFNILLLLSLSGSGKYKQYAAFKFRPKMCPSCTQSLSSTCLNRSR